MQQHATKRKEIKKRIECVIQLARHLLHLVCVCVCVCVCFREDKIHVDMAPYLRKLGWLRGNAFQMSFKAHQQPGDELRVLTC